MNDKEKIRYLSARVDALEAIVNNIINYNQASMDMYSNCIPSAPNFWCVEMQNLRNQMLQQLEQEFPDEVA